MFDLTKNLICELDSVSFHRDFQEAKCAHASLSHLRTTFRLYTASSWLFCAQHCKTCRPFQQPVVSKPIAMETIRNSYLTELNCFLDRTAHSLVLLKNLWPHVWLDKGAQRGGSTIYDARAVHTLRTISPRTITIIITLRLFSTQFRSFKKKKNATENVENNNAICPMHCISPFGKQPIKVAIREGNCKGTCRVHFGPCVDKDKD